MVELNDALNQKQRQCLNYIQSLGIYELRALSRTFGNTSPTTTKRSDHINYIMDKIIADEDIHILPTRKGRPHKEIDNINQILSDLSEITGKNYSVSANNSSKPIENTLVFNQPIETETIENMPFVCQGIVVYKNDSPCLYDDKRDMFISILEDPFLIDEGDYVLSHAYYNDAKKAYEIESVEVVNYTLKESYSPFENVNVPVENRVFKSEIGSLQVGKNYLFNFENFDQGFEDLKYISSILHENATVCVALLPEECDRKFKTVFDYIISPLKKEATDKTEIKLAVLKDHIARLQEKGIKIAVFFQDLETFESIISSKHFIETISGKDKAPSDYIKELLSLAGSYINSDVTLFYTKPKLTNGKVSEAILKSSTPFHMD